MTKPQKKTHESPVLPVITRLRKPEQAAESNPLPRIETLRRHYQNQAPAPLAGSTHAQLISEARKQLSAARQKAREPSLLDTIDSYIERQKEEKKQTRQTQEARHRTEGQMLRTSQKVIANRDDKIKATRAEVSGHRHEREERKRKEQQILAEAHASSELYEKEKADIAARKAREAEEERLEREAEMKARIERQEAEERRQAEASLRRIMAEQQRKNAEHLTAGEHTEPTPRGKKHSRVSISEAHQIHPGDTVDESPRQRHHR